VFLIRIGSCRHVCFQELEKLRQDLENVKHRHLERDEQLESVKLALGLEDEGPETGENPVVTSLRNVLNKGNAGFTRSECISLLTPIHSFYRMKNPPCRRDLTIFLFRTT
jgi:hypothetical protein